jgi:uncharacterized protein Yka (UPF0111/DUF47 family)
MQQKTGVLADLGEHVLLLPTLLTAALGANDRAKYYMSLLQSCRDHALRPDLATRDLRFEREACGEDDAALDSAAGGGHVELDGTLVMPHAAAVHQRLLAAVEQMIAPLRSAGSILAPVERYERRLSSITDTLGPITGDRVPTGYVEGVTHADGDGPDSVHLLVMDLHRELNRVQAELAQQRVDGAFTYGLADDDIELVRAFMKGVNATAPLKLGHPGLVTTAVRADAQMIIQNDLGTTDAHVVVIRITGLDVSITYTDVHRRRVDFFKALLERTGLVWGAGPATGADYYTALGQGTSASAGELQQLLQIIGSKLVFVIDWNRARKGLARFLRQSDAIAALRWAADNGYGHCGFLEAGGERLIYGALERTKPAQLRVGARLDEILGRAAALAFVQATLRIAGEGMQEHRSLRLMRDEVQAEFLQYLHESQQGVLVLVADHAALIIGLALMMRDALQQLRDSAGRGELTQVAARAKRWETKADDIVTQAREAQRRVPDADTICALLPVADDAADDLEESIFLLTLVPIEASTQALAAVEPLAGLAVRSAEEYVKCVESARDARRSATREDVRDFLLSVDRLTTIEHDTDQAVRDAEAALLAAAIDFRSLHVLSHVAHTLEESVDALARGALELKDVVLAELLVA